ncbi:MAG: HDIG domain-containing protein [Eubacteriales bacterium]|nr:HDIG domain-containing protein [Eubacteriales bacterium]
MKIPPKIQRLIAIMLMPVLIISIVAAIYYGSIPEKYDLTIGDSSPFDITATRSIRDQVATDLRASKAAADVESVVIRSEDIVLEVMTLFDQVFDLISAQRWDIHAGQNTNSDVEQVELSNTEIQVRVDSVIYDLDQEFQIVLSEDDIKAFLMMDPNRYNSNRGHARSIATLLMSEPVDGFGLKSALNDRIANLETTLTFNQEDATRIGNILSVILKPNIAYDMLATENARQAAFDKVQNNPVMINRGTRIVSQGDVITTESYTLLSELDLIDSSGFDYRYLFGILLLISLLFFIAWFYLKKYENESIHLRNNRFALVIAVLIPLIASVALARFEPLASPVYFAAVLIAAYFGFRTASLMSFLLMTAILPMTGFDPVFAVVAITGSIVAALFTKGITRRDNYAYIMIATAGANLVATLSFGILLKEEWQTLMLKSAVTALSGSISVIAAIGIMPLFEMIFNTVSPLRLIELSQPGHPLLRRLFIEAPGTSQHSMMVANLADAAADAIGANPLLARVGAYYHDIGKLENPLLFTENQNGVNPHDKLQPLQSARIIIGHPEAGVRIGKRYRLPLPLINIISEHHGSTMQAYFYQKAKKISEESGIEDPDIDQFKYQCSPPTSRESAVVMLSDSVEAAMKSTNTHQLEAAETLIRRIIKIKNDQDQLVQSGLSFKDIETIIAAFMQVYAGHFHERIKYPDARPV